MRAFGRPARRTPLALAALNGAVPATNLLTWVGMSQTSGQTPRNVVVTANPKRVAPGTYSGPLTVEQRRYEQNSDRALYL